MRIFYAFLIIVTATILFLLPYSDAIYDFITDVRSDTFNLVSTGVGVSTANVTLHQDIYDDDTSTISISSNLTADSPILSAYGAGDHSVLADGLSANTTRTLTVTYDIASLTDSTAVNTFIGQFDMIWLLCLVAFIPVSLIAIFTGRA